MAVNFAKLPELLRRKVCGPLVRFAGQGLLENNYRSGFGFH